MECCFIYRASPGDQFKSPDGRCFIDLSPIEPFSLYWPEYSGNRSVPIQHTVVLNVGRQLCIGTCSTLHPSPSYYVQYITNRPIVLSIHFCGYGTISPTFLLTAKPQKKQTNKQTNRNDFQGENTEKKFKQQTPSVTVREGQVRWLPRRSESKQGPQRPLDDKKTLDQAYSGSTELFSFWET